MRTAVELICIVGLVVGVWWMARAYQVAQDFFRTRSVRVGSTSESVDTFLRSSRQ